MGFTFFLIRLLVKLGVHTFFGEVDVVGMENLPKKGPVILVGNHKNQFVDAAMVWALVDRPVSFLIAEKSMHRPIIGDIARLSHAIPVIRAADRAKACDGKILSFDEASNVLTGEATCAFTTSVKKGEMIALKGMKKVAPLQVVEVESDTRVKVKPPVKPEDEADGTGGQPTTLVIPTEGVSFKVIPKIDQSEIFGKTHDALCNGRCIGIFPEGGSSDRTDLLPLKAGVSVMALGAADRGAAVSVIPFGINYSHAHRWRSRVLVDVGRPLKVAPEILEQYRKGEKREAYAAFLKQVESSLRSVTFNAPDKHILNVLRTMRRMYQGDIQLPPKRFMELNRRFALAFGRFKDDERFLGLVDQVSEYMGDLRKLRLTDRQVATFPPVGSLAASSGAFMNLMIDLGIILFAIIFALPAVIVFAPMLLRIRYVVQKEVTKALAGSTVKVEAKDVEASQKMMGAFIWVPVTMILWTALIGGLTGGLWPKTSPYLPGTPLDWLFLNAAWIIPVAFFLCIFPYGFVSMLIGEVAIRRFMWLNRHWVVARALFRPTTSTAGKIRAQRKNLALVIQDFFEEIVVPAIPEWQQDPIINRETIVDRRRASDRKLAAKVEIEIKSLVSRDLEANNPGFDPSTTPASPKSPRMTVMQVREAVKGLDAKAVEAMFTDRSESHN